MHISESTKTTHGNTEATDFVQRHSSVIAPLALVSNGTQRVTGSGANPINYTLTPTITPSPARCVDDGAEPNNARSSGTGQPIL